MQFIAAEESAGNNNFNNEKLGIFRFTTDEGEELLDTSKGTEYLIKLASVIPKKIVRGSGFVNNLINNLPFELHYPGIIFLGPGTKLDERLARGDKPVNKLDEAGMEHDIYYKHHKDVKDRHKADVVLENKAWERVLDPTASLGEKAAAYLTTNMMKVKRHFGMGLK